MSFPHNPKTCTQFRCLQARAHQHALDKGFHDKPRSFAEDMVLIHCEVSEAVEAYRDEDDEGMREELADVVIRAMDTAGKHNINLAEEIIKKMDKNDRREYRHGGKKL